MFKFTKEGILVKHTVRIEGNERIERFEYKPYFIFVIMFIGGLAIAVRLWIMFCYGK